MRGKAKGKTISVYNELADIRWYQWWRCPVCEFGLRPLSHIQVNQVNHPWRKSGFNMLPRITSQMREGLF